MALRKNAKCYGCIYFLQCDKRIEMKCSDNNYFLFTTKQDKELCDMLCGGVENDDRIED